MKYLGNLSTFGLSRSTSDLRKINSKWKLNAEGVLKNTIIVSQIFVPEGQEITNKFVKNNLIEEKDLKDLAKLQTKTHECPNLYKGKSSIKNKVFEKFIVKESVTITKKTRLFGKKSLRTNP